MLSNALDICRLLCRRRTEPISPGAQGSSSLLLMYRDQTVCEQSCFLSMAKRAPRIYVLHQTRQCSRAAEKFQLTEPIESL
jgi:hypothetical protein